MLSPTLDDLKGELLVRVPAGLPDAILLGAAGASVFFGVTDTGSVLVAEVTDTGGVGAGPFPDGAGFTCPPILSVFAGGCHFGFFSSSFLFKF